MRHQRPGKAAAGFEGLAPAVSPLAMGNREPVLVDGSAVWQEADRRQRDIVGGVLVEPDF